MLRNLLGIELSQLKFALLCSYIGGILLIITGLTFALPSLAGIRIFIVSIKFIKNRRLRMFIVKKHPIFTIILNYKRPASS